MKRNPPWLGGLLPCLILLLTSFSLSAQVTADFSAPVTSGCSPLIVNFQNLSTGTGLSYQWNLGNGNNSVSENPSASYINPGSYTITLTTTGQGGSDVETKTAYITVFTPPIPDISLSQNIGCYPFSVDFTDLSSPGDSPIATWSWDFGDGGTSTDQNPSHLYTTPGIFDVTLLLTDENGCASNLSFNDLVESNNNRPTAAFTGDPVVSCLPPVDVAFANTSFGGTGNLTYVWNLGDGNTSTLSDPLYTYTVADNYDVSLTVTDELGCSNTLMENEYITIVDNVSIDFVAANTTVCLGQQVSFVDISSPTPTNWNWDFGDGTTSSIQFPSHLYATPGTYEVSLSVNYSQSCQGTETKTAYITVGDIPFVDFSADALGGCETPFSVNFTNNSVGSGPLSYIWSLGDGNVSTDENPSNTYTDPGSYTVSLTATNDQGCSNTLTEPNYINVSETSADFLPDVFGFCQPLEVNFSDLSVSGTNIVNYEWDFGDGGTSTLQNPTYTYADSGIFDVSLVITNDLGCTDTLTRTNYIFVYTPPTAAFNDNDTVICQGDLAFTDLSLNATDWYWDFGDGTSSTEQNPIHEYDWFGYFNVTLIALNNGCSDTVSVSNMVYVSPPIANFHIDHSCDDPNTFTLSNSSESFTSFYWQLPDGSTSTEDPLTLTYSDIGDHIIHIRTENDTSGCVSHYTDTLQVTGLDAAFDAANTQDCSPLHVTYTDQSVGVSEWLWFFGDGDHSIQPNPTHNYSDIGSYSVSLVVTDVNGCTDTIVQPGIVTVTGSIVNFGIDSTQGCDTLAVDFTDLTSPPGSVAIWQWDFGDGSTSSDQSPTHIYQDAGEYDVSLTITDVGGCTNTIEQPGIVNYIPYPVPSFTVDAQLGCIGQPFTFTNNSTGNAVSYLWNFGNGGTSTDENPVYAYDTEGLFSVTLTAFNSNGCDSSVTQIGLIDIQLPNADFSAFPTFAFCPPLLVSFTDLSSSDVVSWFWDFGDGSSSNLQSPAHIYTASGLFSISLVVTNANGCTDTILSPDLIELSGPSGEFSFFPDTIGCPPYEITYTATANNVSAYTWDFGDGYLGTGESAIHSYAQIGSYIPTLILEDDNGCTFTYQSSDTLYVQPLAVDAGMSDVICNNDTVQLHAFGGTAFSWFPPTGLDDASAASPLAYPETTTVYAVTVNLGLCQNVDSVTVFVNPAPEVNFIADEVCFGSLTQFTDFSAIADPDSITSWSWNLSEGSSTDANPTFQYSSAGVYDVSLQIESSSGCIGIGTGTATVNPSPTADFSANDTCLYTSTSFADQSTVDPGSIIAWNWQLGNGSSTSQQNPSVVYSADSVYQVMLIVTAEGGCTDTVSQAVTVFPLPNAEAIAENVCLGEMVQFTDSSTIASGSIAQWDWVLGDGSLSGDQNLQHLYGTDDTYIYALTVTSDQGCTDATSGAVTVHPLPVSDFQMTISSSCFAPVSVNLLNLSQDAVQFEWDHDNGTIDNAFNSTAVFDTVGQYDIQLWVANQFGCADSSVQTFDLYPTVVADFETSYPIGCQPWSVDFTDLSENGVTYSWDFSDVDGSSTPDPTHIFEDPGLYAVQLIVEGTGGCADTVVYNDLITVWENPTAIFEYQNVADPIANGTVAFINTSTPHVSSWWDFGDGGNSTSENTTHKYDFFGNKLITLAIADANGCVDTLQLYVPVDFFGGLYVPNAVIPTDDNQEVRVFMPKGTGLGTYRCIVFDKWGNKLWESTELKDGSPTEGWDATYKGAAVPQGAYVWRIDAVFANGEIWEGMKDANGNYHQVGSITVIR